MKILVADPVSDQGVAILQKEHQVDIKLKLSPDELITIIPDYDALVVRSETKVTKAVIEAADNLKVIGRAGVGVDNIDVEAATKKGIIVLNAPEGNTIAATEHTMAMMLALARNIPQAHRSVQRRQMAARQVRRGGNARQDAGNTRHGPHRQRGGQTGPGDGNESAGLRPVHQRRSRQGAGYRIGGA